LTETGYLIVFLLGAGLLFSGLWQVRQGIKDIDRVQREIAEQADELQSEILKIKNDLHRIQNETE
jgi:hypothetical protein